MRKEVVNIVENGGRLFHSVKSEMKTKTHPLHLSIEVRGHFNVTPLAERSEYTSQMNNSARERQIDLTVAATDVAL